MTAIACLGRALLIAAACSALPAAGAERTTDVRVDGAVVRLHMDEEAFALGREAFSDWVRDSARTVSAYYGRFPVKELYLALLPQPGSGVKHGQAFAFESATVNVRIGADSGLADLREDWILIHEMIHFAFPKVARRHHWIEEGLSVYVESIARANRGELSPEFVWRGFVRGMPHGLPRSGDQGLDATPTWGRTYWGGALFCLLADVEIRRRTDNRRSLRDALRAVVASGLSMLDERPLVPVLQLADAATGETVLMELYEDHRGTAVDVDLERLWRELGVEVNGAGLRFDEQAPLAAVRTAITSRE